MRCKHPSNDNPDREHRRATRRSIPPALASIALLAATISPVTATTNAIGTDSHAVDDGDYRVPDAHRPIASEGPRHVRIAKHEGRETLFVDDEPFIVRGAGIGDGDPALIEALKDAGGNSFRTWDAAALDVQLAEAAKHGLMVLVGLGAAQHMQGFDYTDAAAVRRQHDRIMQVVERYRNHPNVLGWIIANELNLYADASGKLSPVDPAAYRAMGEIVDAIHRVDRHHPVTFSFAFTHLLKEDIATALEHAPALDFVALQAYAALPVIPKLVRSLDNDLPFMVTEYGPLGHWEMPHTAWGREIEEPSGVKAEGMVSRMRRTIVDDPTGRLIGDYVFLWGQKQERTPTWYGLFTEAGLRTAGVDEMTRVWTGDWPANRAPRARSISIDGLGPKDSVVLEPGDVVTAKAEIEEPDGDPLAVRWELLEEVHERSAGGHHEDRPRRLPLVSAPNDDAPSGRLRFETPKTAGEYRLFVYARDDFGGVATANFPFRVE